MSVAAGPLSSRRLHACMARLPQSDFVSKREQTWRTLSFRAISRAHAALKADNATASKYFKMPVSFTSSLRYNPYAGLIQSRCHVGTAIASLTAKNDLQATLVNSPDPWLSQAPPKRPSQPGVLQGWPFSCLATQTRSTKSRVTTAFAEYGYSPGNMTFFAGLVRAGQRPWS
jgi:hypothetical protein